MPEPSDAERCAALPIALRAFATRAPTPGAEPADESADAEVRRTKSVVRRYPSEALIFDTETLGDPAQRLLVGVWRFYRDRAGAEPGATCVEEGMFFPDDLPERDPDGFRTLQEYATGERPDVAAGFSTKLELQPLSWWLEHRLYLYGYRHRNRCLVVAYNLPFDLGRVASHWKPATGRYRGGFSLGIWGEYGPRGGWHDARFHPRIRYKAIDPRRTLFSWGTLAKQDADGLGIHDNLLDLHTLVFALTDENLRLPQACKRFGDPWKKGDVGYGVITRDLLVYAREDVEHTAQLYRNTLAELRIHEGVDLSPAKLYSPATVGSRYLDAMGLHPPTEKFELSDALQGHATSAFFGGRAEARIVRTTVPVAYVDATSMYPTVNALLGTWSLLRAARLELENATRPVRSLLMDPDLTDRCYDRSFWRDAIGVTLVELDHPEDQILPVRAWYDEEATDPRIGVNALTYDGRLWYLLPDVIASVLLSQGPPVVRRAIRMRGVGVQRGLHAIKLRGARSIDPRRSDPFVAMIEERRRVERDVIDEDERKRLSLFLKITANATAYGVLARFDRRDLAKPTKIRVHGPDLASILSTSDHPEDPGPHCFPAVAASLTAGARLMLAMLERRVVDAGSTYALCDTDSMAIVATPTGGQVPCATADKATIQALSAPEVLMILQRFEGLNPYDPSLVPELWKVEHGSLTRPLRCYAISAKRYMLLSDEEGRPTPVRVMDDLDAADRSLGADGEDDGLADWSEHGLGIYLDPYGPERESRDAEGRRLWIREVWEWISAKASGEAPSLPRWAEQPALTRFTISSPRLLGWFAGHDRTATREERMRPGSFGMLAHTIAMRGGDVEDLPLPATGYEPDPDKWRELRWYDRRTGEPIKVTWVQPGTDPEAFANEIARGAVPVRTLGHILTRYIDQPEHKSLAPDASLSAGTTAGLLLRRRVESAPALTDLTGKEGTKLIERATGEVTDPSEYRVRYGERGERWADLVVPVLRQMGVQEVIRRTGRRRSAVFEAVAGRARADVYVSAAAAFARKQSSVELPRNDLAALYCFLKQGDPDDVRRCGWCSRPLRNGSRSDARYCSSSCRQAARRSR